MTISTQLLDYSEARFLLVSLYLIPECETQIGVLELY